MLYKHLSLSSRGFLGYKERGLFFAEIELQNVGFYMSAIKFLGIYSGKLNGISGHSKTPFNREYWYVWFSKQDQRYLIQLLDQNKIPHEQSFIVDTRTFGMNFSEEKVILQREPKLPNLKMVQVYKPDPNLNKMQAANNDVVFIKGQREAAQQNTRIRGYDKQPPSAPMQAPQAPPKQIPPPEFFDGEDGLIILRKDDELGVQVGEKNREAVLLNYRYKKEFSEAMALWNHGRKNIALTRFEDLLRQDDSLVEAHKHIFADCAVKLRKIQELDLAIAFALRSTQLSPRDSHAFFNAARLFFEVKEYQEAVNYLNRALDLQPDLSVAQRLLSMITAHVSRLDGGTRKINI